MVLECFQNAPRIRLESCDNGTRMTSIRTICTGSRAEIPSLWKRPSEKSAIADFLIEFAEIAKNPCASGSSLGADLRFPQRGGLPRGHRSWQELAQVSGACGAGLIFLRNYVEIKKKSAAQLSLPWRSQRQGAIPTATNPARSSFLSQPCLISGRFYTGKFTNTCR